MKSLTARPSFVDVLPISADHNFRARLLRNGLTVTSFNTLEGFLLSRVAELMDLLTKTKIGYANLGEGLREFLTLNALQGLITESGFLDKPDRLAHVEQHIPNLGRFGDKRPRFTGFGFSPKGSNVSDGDIPAFFKALDVQGGWNILSQMSARIGVGQVSLIDSYRNFSKARNKAAHDSLAAISTSDLDSYLQTACLVAIAFDIIASNAISAYTRHNTLQAAKAAANALPSQFRFLDEQVAGGFLEHFNGKIHSHPDISTAVARATKRQQKAFIVIRDKQQLPVRLI